ncbi:dual specificity calcium/calmodulin-dependent 3',5'-cyclic nucleotide phosphodiesterase 1C-like isoform X1 [Ciona intestinalis]
MSLCAPKDCHELGTANTGDQSGVVGVSNQYKNARNILNTCAWNEVLQRSTVLSEAFLRVCEPKPLTVLRRTNSESKIVEERQKSWGDHEALGKEKPRLRLSTANLGNRPPLQKTKSQQQDVRFRRKLRLGKTVDNVLPKLPFQSKKSSSPIKESKSTKIISPRQGKGRPLIVSPELVWPAQSKGNKTALKSRLADEVLDCCSPLRLDRSALPDMNRDISKQTSHRDALDSITSQLPVLMPVSTKPEHQRSNEPVTNGLNGFSELSEHKVGNDNITNGASSSLCRLIEVDGVNYRVTMEVPGGTKAKKGVAPTKRSEPTEAVKLGAALHRRSKPPSRQGQESSRQNYDGVAEKSGFEVGLSTLSGTSFTEQDPLRALWLEERDKNSRNVDLTRCHDCDLADPTSNEGLNQASLRLRALLHSFNDESNSVSSEHIRHNIEYAIAVMESRYVNRIADISSDDEVPATLSGEGPVPPEIKRWLVQTFTSRRPDTRNRKESDNKRSLRSVVHAVQAGMFVERMFRKTSVGVQNLPPEVQLHFKNIDSWSYNVFELERISEGNSLKFVFYELLNKYDLIRKFKIPLKSLFAYCTKLQRGYRKHNNRYHNPIHAADVAQSLNCLLVNSGFVHWLSDVEMFSMIMAAIVHDLEHSGTTNTFHTNTRSPLAQMYNDKSVLENHHISSAFRLLNEEDCDILANFSKDDYQEARTLMIDMVLATDMSQHFGQLKRLQSNLQHPENLEKSRAMCLMIHSADINHPSKPWNLHCRWTERLVVEFFEQGDQERDLGLPLSPLCDRHTTMVAQSQIGFIDYVIKPTFDVLYDIFRNVNGPVVRDAILSIRRASKADVTSLETPCTDDVLKRRFSDVSSYCTALTNQKSILESLAKFETEFFSNIEANRTHWQKRDEIERANEWFGEKAFTFFPLQPEGTSQTNSINGYEMSPQRPENDVNAPTPPRTVSKTSRAPTT